MKESKSVKILIRAVLAGAMISVGCVVYGMCQSKLLGAVLFSFGLFCICNYKLNLYTGKIGYLVRNRSVEYLAELGLTLVGNLCGAFLTALLIRQTRIAGKLLEFVGPVAQAKNADTFLSLLILSFFCGILMFLGVDIFSRSQYPVSQVLAVVFAVTIFILAGFEHCVANMFYYFFASALDVPRLLVMILGNSLGGMAVALLLDLGTPAG